MPRNLALFRIAHPSKDSSSLPTKGAPWMDKFLNYERYGANGVLVDLSRDRSGSYVSVNIVGSYVMNVNMHEI